MIEAVGIQQIADRAGVEEITVRKWIERHDDFPQPRWRVSDRNAWDWYEVQEWLYRTGRLTGDTWPPVRNAVDRHAGIGTHPDQHYAQRLRDEWEATLADLATIGGAVAGDQTGADEYGVPYDRDLWLRARRLPEVAGWTYVRSRYPAGSTLPCELVYTLTERGRREARRVLAARQAT